MSARLLIGYDGSPAAKAAITTAGALFREAEAVVANVHSPLPVDETGALARTALPESMIEEGMRHLRDEISERAQATSKAGVAIAASTGLRPSPRAAPGVSVWRTLRALAGETAADAIVVGTVGHGPFERVMLGSTASTLLHHADRPLLVVPDHVAVHGPLLVGYDASDGARAALRFVAADLRPGPVLVAHAWHSPPRQANDHVRETEAEAMAEAGAAFAAGLGLDAQPWTARASIGAWRALLRGGAQHDAAAIVVGSRGRGAVASTVLGSVASGLVHAAERVVLVVP